jgi:hypothetical protein
MSVLIEFVEIRVAASVAGESKNHAEPEIVQRSAVIEPATGEKVRGMVEVNS